MVAVVAETLVVVVGVETKGKAGGVVWDVMCEKSVVVAYTLRSRMTPCDDMQYLRDVIVHRDASPWK